MKRLFFLLLLLPYIADAQVISGTVVKTDTVKGKGTSAYAKQINTMKIKFGDGTFQTTATGSTGAQPTKTFFVSTGFSNANPYFPTVKMAVDSASPGTVILVYPGHYAEGFTVADDSISIIGFGNPFYDSTTATIRGGAVVHGTSSGGGKKGLRIENMGFDLASAVDVYTCGPQGGSRIEHTYKNCIFKGSGFANGYHAFLSQGGSHIKIEGCEFYNSTHGIALRCSYVNASDIYIQDCSGSSIIIKSDVSSGGAYDINISNFLMRSTVANYCGAIVVQSMNAAFETKRISLSNGTCYDVNPNAITIQQVAGNCQMVTVTNVHAYSTYASGFKVEGGAGITFVNCTAQGSGTYGFENTGGTDVALIGCFENGSSSGAYTGSFPMNQLSGSYRTMSLDYAAASSGFGSYLYYDIVNKLSNGWVHWATRRTWSSEASVTLDRIDTIKFVDGTTMHTAATGSGVGGGSLDTIRAGMGINVLRNNDSVTTVSIADTSMVGINLSTGHLAKAASDDSLTDGMYDVESPSDTAASRDWTRSVLYINQATSSHITWLKGSYIKNVIIGSGVAFDTTTGELTGTGGPGSAGIPAYPDDSTQVLRGDSTWGKALLADTTGGAGKTSSTGKLWLDFSTNPPTVKVATDQTSGDTTRQLMVSTILGQAGTGSDSSLISTSYKFFMCYSTGIVIDTIIYAGIGGSSPNVKAKILYCTDFTGSTTLVDTTTCTSNSTVTKQSGANINQATIPKGYSVYLTFDTVGNKFLSFSAELLGHKQ